MLSPQVSPTVHVITSHTNNGLELEINTKRLVTKQNNGETRQCSDAQVIRVKGKFVLEQMDMKKIDQNP